MSASDAPSAARKPLQPWKLGLFAVVTVTLFFLVCEGVLAIARVHPAVEQEDPYLGFSGGLPLFAEERNPDGSVDMVTAPNKRAYFNLQRFPAVKPAHGFRIFTLGASTTYGHPYDDRTSFSSWMREILPRADASRTWEVINAGGISYASYRVANLMQELVRYHPDLFVVYSGQNEFLERRTYSGIIEANPHVNALGALAARTRTYTVLRKAVNTVRTRDVRAARRKFQMTGEVDAMLDAIGGLSQYARDDTLARQIGEHYAYNVRRMIRIAHDAGVGIIFVTPASNSKDCSPFKSQHSSNVDAQAQARFDAAMERGTAALEHGDATTAESDIATAVGIDPRYAQAQYTLGRARLARGDATGAAACFQRALDEDVCPLRQPTWMREELRHVVQAEHAPLVDFEAILEDSARARLGSPLLGSEYFLDHVHPTIAGHRILAVAILNAMAKEHEANLAADWQDRGVKEATQVIEARLDVKMQALGLRNVARVFNWAGKTADAGRLIRQAAELVPEDVDNFVVLGSQAAAEKRPADAIAYYERALAINPNQLEARNNLAVELSQAGQYAAALAQYEEILKTRPDRWAVHANAGFACLQLGRADCAIEHYSKVVALRPEDAVMRVQLGRAYARGMQIDQAARAFRAATEIDPHNADAWEGLGATYAGRALPDSALAAYRRAVAAAPTSAPAHLALGSALWQQGQFGPARTELEQAVRIDPKLPEAHNVLGLVEWRQGNIDAAIANFETELQINPQHPDAPANRAFILVAQGQPEAAIRAYHEALKAKPRDPKTLNALAWLLATAPEDRLRNGKEALVLAARADSLTGHRHPAALNTLAAAYAECGRFDEAVRASNEASQAARNGGQASMAQEIEALRERYYAQNKPYREKQRKSATP